MKIDWRRIVRFIAFVATLLVAGKALDPILDLILHLGWLEPVVRQFGPLFAARSVAVLGVTFAVCLAMLVWSVASRLLKLPIYDPSW
jgi:hypothetical protein